MAKVLVIDDSGFQRRWITRTLASLGHKTVEAVNGLEGLKAADAERPDCITVDLNMPEMDGIAFLGNLRSEELHIPVIVITANIQAETKKVCKDLGAAAFLNKPFKSDELMQALDECLGASAEGSK